MSFNIAIISHNEDLDDQFETFSKHIKIVNTTSNTLMNDITNNLMSCCNTSVKPECSGFVVYESYMTIYQMLYLKDNTLPNNVFASYFTSNKRLLHGNAIMLKLKIGSDKICIDDSICSDDIKMIFDKKMIHKGIFIGDNGTMNEFNYKKSPSEYFTQYNDDAIEPKTKEYRFTLFGYDLLIYYLVEPNSTINKDATKLAGTEKILDSVILIHVKYDMENNATEFLDISETEVRQLLSLCINSDREYDDSEHLINDKITVVNRYNIVAEKIEKHKIICASCSKEIEHKYVCTGCYQTMYDSEECQKNDWDEHKKKCLYKKPFINQKNM